jgi:hypothetical protein
VRTEGVIWAVSAYAGDKPQSPSLQFIGWERFGPERAIAASLLLFLSLKAMRPQTVAADVMRVTFCA